MHERSWPRLSSACALSVLLAACGGGSGDDPAVGGGGGGGNGTITGGGAGGGTGGGVTGDTIVLTLPRLEAPSSDGETVCADRSIGAVTLDNLFVPDGRSCQLDGTSFEGSIKVGTRSTLEAQRIRVNGNIQAEGSTWVKVIGSSTVGGSVQIKQGRAAAIDDTRISGDLQFDQQTLAVRASRNGIGGNLQAVSNSGGVTLNDNTMIGNLQCKQNTPAPTGGDNVAASKEDQCRNL